jgi:hypothetical protein
MTISVGIREVAGEMIKLQHLLMRTSPSHDFSEEESRLFYESIKRAEQALKRITGEVKLH